MLALGRERYHTISFITPELEALSRRRKSNFLVVATLYVVVYVRKNVDRWQQWSVVIRVFCLRLRINALILNMKKLIHRALKTAL